MRRMRAVKRSHIVSLVIAGGLGYVFGGGYNTVALQTTTDLTAAQTVALRFPQELADAVDAGPDAGHMGPMAAAKAAVMGGAQLALLNPEPMGPETSVPKTIPQSSAPAFASAQTGAEAAASPAAVVPAGMQLASADDASLPRVTTAVPAPAQAIAAKPVAATAATPASTSAAATPAPAHKRAERPGFVLNDAQIASIKQRLHLSSDQERMWPAVEAALRNLAYVRSRDAQRRGAPANGTQLAAADPNSIEVQGLKSAAIPLLMSFNDEQRDEVRNLAHVMGLDQLATQF